MKKFILLLSLLSFSVSAQEKYLTRTGSLNFEASVPSFEEVAASNNSTTAIFNTNTGEFAALALVKGFRFKNALMEEHFNENYAESDEFPKATFKGSLHDFDINSTETSYTITGTLNFHGQTKVYDDISLTIEKKEGKIIMKGEFQAKASDFNIDIPKIVQNKVAEDIHISFMFELHKK